jgi:hypothetical protein
MCLLASFCTHEIDSTPPATTTSFSPAMTRCAAMAIVCRPLEQKRIDRHAAGRDRQAAAQRDLACDVAAGRALGRGAAHDDVVDLGGVDAGALDRGLDGVPAEGRCHGSC